jgi:protein-tyrosine-phosphatase
MAEAIARYDAVDVIMPSSAGLSPLGFIPEQTKQTLQLNGYSWKELCSVRLTKEAVGAADLVINMSGSPRETQEWDVDKVEDWMVEDPYGGTDFTYQRIFEGIQRRVNQLAAELREKRQKRATAR